MYLCNFYSLAIEQVQFSYSVISDSLWLQGLQHDKPPGLSSTPGAYSNACPLFQWSHPTISSTGIPFSSQLQSFQASGSFPVSQFFVPVWQRIGVSASASVLTMNIQDFSLLGWTLWISLQPKRLSRVFFNTTIQRHEFFIDQLSLESNTHIQIFDYQCPWTVVHTFVCEYVSSFPLDVQLGVAW